MKERIKHNALSLRKNMTEEEKNLWFHLRDKRLEGYKFRRQVPIENYIVDFVCYRHKLIIELDGSQHFDDNALVYDAKRTQRLNQLGFHVVRFTNDEINFDLENVLTTIYYELSGEI
ncbi:endonuclease domain-containing protein [Testudinibacter aquarius]|uniref:Endonuclease domain-containing protein n=1 Tax=Testudinibacter aquarius TaxID=1524974 RepID=A0A4R3YA26_9PAST|nr:DUF559 domain-containing protein [Testudinibacter aquarius]KAE9525868.1 hypothetical protein A1D24_03670 [Testudinibacter aquarius]TCV88760.1 very-short-patch-repair endonuclease [Testudinibacter aquarius]TNG93484.1 endonuclease domain-containing protein [Testudinibacter aquarius]